MKPSVNEALKIMKTGKFPENGVIDLKSQDLNDKDMEALALQLCSSTDGQIMTYNLSGNHFTEKGLQHLWYALPKAPISSPIIVDLTHNNLGDRAIVSLANCIRYFPPFVTLKLGHNPFRDIRPLLFALSSGKCPSNLTIDLTGVGFSLNAVEQLQTALAKAPEDLTLNLSYTGMKDRNGMILMHAFESLEYPRKQTLILSYNGLTSLSIRALAKALEKRNARHRFAINLEGNQLKSDGLKALSVILMKDDAPLLSLNLRNTGINGEGIKALAQALSSGRVPQGTCLDLSNNQLQDDDLDSLWTALQSKKCPSHLTLILNDNKLSTKTLTALGPIVSTLSHGLSLSLTGNTFNKPALREFITELHDKMLPFSLHLEINSQNSKTYQQEQQEINILCGMALQTALNFLTILQGQAQVTSPLSLLPKDIIRHIFSFVAPKEDLTRIAKLHDQASNKLSLIKRGGFFISSPKAEGKILPLESKNTLS
ncbi:hypothetical protein Lery_0934 [Legionella erythra]|uniref:F-box domain-containing protein n=2 Tax=Legionella erythra TaxID=448 RepID=A0A0W0TRM8_LEGER|nr:hypothetical protein Lery_0934 [Legionella erythra]